MDLSSADFIQNPYPIYEQLHDKHPIYHCSERDFYYVVNYEYVKTLFVHPNVSSNRVKALTRNLPEPFLKAIEPLTSSLSQWLLFNDPPFHTQLRRAINSSLSNQVVKSLQTKIEQTAHNLLNDCHDAIEIMNDFAYPLPVLVISDMMAVPNEDQPLIKQWSADIARFLGDKTTADDIRIVQNSVIAASDYFTKHLNQQRNGTPSPLVQCLLDFQSKEPSFSDEQLVANLIALIFAGHETTTNAIGNSIATLIKHKDKLPGSQQLIASIDSVVEECLRFESPAQRMGRLTTEDITIGNIAIASNKRLLLILGAANRDPSVFESPNEFIFNRDHNKHLAFGYGTHHCSGISLARQEIKTALSLFLERFDLQSLAIEEMSVKQNLGLRGLDKLGIRSI